MTFSEQHCCTEQLNTQLRSETVPRHLLELNMYRPIRSSETLSPVYSTLKKKKAMNVVCFNSASPFISLAEKQKEKICTGIHLITQEVFGWGNGLVSHKLWTSSPQRSQRRYQSIVFALARTHTANTRCEKQGSETHTHRWWAVSFSGTISLLNLRTAVILHTWQDSQLKYAQMLANSPFLLGWTSIGITEAVGVFGANLPL